MVTPTGNHRKSLVFFLLIFLSTPLLIRTEETHIPPETQALMQEATSFFHQAGENDNPEQATKFYEKALLRYQKINKSIPSGKVYYNIGNTYFRMGDIGQAIVNYRRAERHIPGDPNLQHNLAYVLGKRQDTIVPQQKDTLLQTLFFWHYDLSQNIRSAIFIYSYIGFWIIVGVVFLTPWQISPWSLAPFAAVTLLLASSLFFSNYGTENTAGVITDREVIARKGDSRSYQSSFTAPLHAGTEFILLEKRGTWLHVELQDGRRCWLPARSSELI